MGRWRVVRATLVDGGAALRHSSEEQRGEELCGKRRESHPSGRSWRNAHQPTPPYGCLRNNPTLPLFSPLFSLSFSGTFSFWGAFFFPSSPKRYFILFFSPPPSFGFVPQPEVVCKSHQSLPRCDPPAPPSSSPCPVPHPSSEEVNPLAVDAPGRHGYPYKMESKTEDKGRARRFSGASAFCHVANKFR